VSKKPLNGKAYGSIGHMPNSRLGPGDHKVPDGMAAIACQKLRDWKDTVIVQEKLDGSCCSIAKIDGQIIPLTRAGYRANTSPYEQHHMFEGWVMQQWGIFSEVLCDGERIVGEWLAQAHGTRYKLRHPPFVAFDLMAGKRRIPYLEFVARVGNILPTPALISYGLPIPVEIALMRAQKANAHGALDPVEGVVYRVEREGEVDFLCKYVRPDKQDGGYFPEFNDGKHHWNWQP
jgi:hypothetical protein